MSSGSASEGDDDNVGYQDIGSLFETVCYTYDVVNQNLFSLFKDSAPQSGKGTI